MRQLNEKKRKYILVCFLGLVFLSVYILTELTPLVADDFNYAFYWAYPARIDSLQMLVRSMGVHRRRTNGRILPHFFVSLFMMLPRWVFSVSNALMAVLFAFTCCSFFSDRGGEKPITAAAFVFILLWICMPVYGQVFLWLDGACNYFWGAVLSWEIICQVLRMEQINTGKYLRMILTLPFAFAAGAWSEHISFSMLVIVSLLIIRSWKKKHRFPFQEAVTLATCCCGYLYLMLAPSMLPSKLKARAKNAVAGHTSMILSLLNRYWWIALCLLAAAVLCYFFLKKKETRIQRIILLLQTGSGLCFAAGALFGIRAFLPNDITAAVSAPLVGLMLMMSIFAWLLQSVLRQGEQKEVIVLSLIFTFGGLCALVLFVAAAYVPARAVCAPVFFICISCALLMSLLQTPPKLLLTAATGIFLLFFVTGAADILTVHQAALERDKEIEKARQTDKVLAVSPYPCRTKYSAQYGLQDVEPGVAWPNDMIALYYGMDQLIVIQP